MFSKIFAVVFLLHFVSINALPLWYHHDNVWNYGPQSIYKDHLKQLGLYPRIFRYGTRSTPVFNRFKQNVQEWNQPNGWLNSYPSVEITPPVVTKKIVQNNDESAENWQLKDGSWNDLGQLKGYQKFKENRLKRMEQEAAEILWRW